MLSYFVNLIWVFPLRRCNLFSFSSFSFLIATHVSPFCFSFSLLLLVPLISICIIHSFLVQQLGSFKHRLFCECLLKHLLGPFFFHVHCFSFLIWFIKLLAYHFCHYNFIKFVIFSTLMASSKAHSLSMSDDDSDGGTWCVHPHQSLQS